jgi:hypothetical protein
MKTTERSGLSFLLVGIPFLLVAMFLQTVTLAGGSYAGVLIAALVFTAAADYYFIQAFRYGRMVIRLCSVLFLLPTLFIIADFLRRAPYMFN